MAATAHLTLVAPDNEKFTVRSALSRLHRRKPNAEYGSRKTNAYAVQPFDLALGQMQMSS
jgi:hypothetical protein